MNLPPPLNHLLLDRFQRIMAAAATKSPVDYGVPVCGTIRFFTIPLETAELRPWYMNVIVSQDRTLGEWLALINKWKDSPLSAKYDAPLHDPNPFTTRRAAAEFLTVLLAKEMRLRCIARKFVMKVRERIYARRIIGVEHDLFTTEAIPAHARVYVRDRDSRAMYCFHVKTATYLLNAALGYSHLGIACPQQPKNPYTNKPWTLGQLMSITTQICTFTFQNMRHMPPPEILKFRKCKHCLETYFKRHGHSLMIAGARSFFKDVQNPDLIETCEDLLDDLYDSVGHDVSYGWRVVKACVLGRLFPFEFRERWDRVLLAVWIHTNFNKCVGFKDHNAIMNEFADLHEESYAWWALQPKSIQQRLVLGSDSDESADSI